MVFFIRGAVRLSLGLHSLALSPSNLHNKCHWYQWKRVSAIGRRVLSFWGEWLHRQVRKYAQVSKVQSRMDEEKRQPSLLMIERPVITVGNFWETYIQRVDFGKNLIWRIKRREIEIERRMMLATSASFSSLGKLLWRSGSIRSYQSRSGEVPATVQRGRAFDFCTFLPSLENPPIQNTESLSHHVLLPLRYVYLPGKETRREHSLRADLSSAHFSASYLQHRTLAGCVCVCTLGVT